MQGLSMQGLKFGKSKETLEKEQAEKQQQLNAEIYAAQMERQKKVEELHKKQKTTKALIILVFVSICIVLIVFGTYNTFIKEPLSTNEVQAMINNTVYAKAFNSEGLDNYLRDNCESLFTKYAIIDKKNNNISSMSVDKDTCHIVNVVKMNQTLAYVYFAVNVKTVEKDSQVTDPKLIDILRKNGFKNYDTVVPNNTSSSQAIPSANANTTAASPKTDKKSSNTDNNENTEDNTNTNDTIEDTTEENNIEDTENTEVDLNDDTNVEPTEEPTPLPTATPTPSSTPEPTPTPTAIVEDVYVPVVQDTNKNEPIEQIEFVLNKGEEAKSYYLMKDGRVFQKGATITKRYTFGVPIEIYTLENAKKKKTGYRPAGEMTLYSLYNIHVTDFKTITTNPMFVFNDKKLADPATLENVQVKVDKILYDLYNKEDTRFDFVNDLKFNTYGAKYEGISSIKYYTESNKMGYNAYVSYTIKTTQGFLFQVNSYLYIEKNGNNYQIQDIL